jgi:outer membrane protein OmpA-like peptidoglycan-associated protein
MRILLVLALFTFLASSMDAQGGLLKKADKRYEAMTYPLAIKSYERYLRKSKNVMAMERVADAYRQIGNTGKAEAWYAEATKQPTVSPMGKFHYGEMLKANGKYEEARKWFEAYLQTGTDPRRASRAIESCDFALEAKRDSGLFNVNTEKFNTKGSDFGPLIYQQGLLKVAERKGAFRKLVNMRNGNSFYDIYEVKFNDSKRGFTSKRIKGKVNRRFHDGPATLNKAQDQMLFTRSFMVKDKKSRAPRDHSKLKLLMSTREGAKWKNIEELPFNSQSYSVGHPALSSDGNTLVFSSDIPGGFGGSDLYVSRKTGKEWSAPENLGSAINTEGNESFPYLHDGGVLFFSSDGHPGLGGMDILAAEPEGTLWAKPTNLGYPLNSAADDFSMCWATNKPTGYFSSNRGGNDDIYSFRRGSSVEGILVDSKTGLPVKNAAIHVTNSAGKETNFITGPDGRFNYLGDWGKDLIVEAKADRYLTARERVTMTDISPVENKTVTIKITPDMIFMLTGQITDARTHQPIEGANVRLISSSEEKLKTDREGKYFKRLEENTEYTVVVMQPGYVPQVHQLSTQGKSISEDFVFNAALEPGNYLLVEGKTYRNADNSPIEAANIHVVNDSAKREARATRSRQDGRFWLVLDPGKTQYLIGSKVAYFSARAEMPAAKVGRDTTVSVNMPMFPYEVGTIVKIIYYDYNKSAILDSASKDLYEVIYFLNDNPEASVELSSHTDSRGGVAYNAKLSQQRADAAVNFILGRGIDGPRIVAKGYGESNVTNQCKDNVTCTEKEHSVNRRTEIKVVEIQRIPGE